MKKILLIALCLLATQLVSHAIISVGDTTNEVYLQNQGYSKQVAETVSVAKARSNGQEYYTKDERTLNSSNKFVKFWRKFYAYTDPAAEDYSFYHHNTDTAAKYSDL